MVVASPEDDVSMVGVRFSVNIEALAWDVSDVSVVSTVVGDHLVVVSSAVLSDDSSNADSESLSSLVGDGIVSSDLRSDSSGSLIEDPPLSSVPWLVVLNSKSELVSTDVLVPEEGSLRSHSSSELELDIISEWLSWPGLGSLIDEPSLVETIVAVVEDHVSVVSLAVSMDIEALSSVVLKVSS